MKNTKKNFLTFNVLPDAEVGLGAVRLHPHRVRLRVQADQDLRLLQPDPAHKVLLSSKATSIVTTVDGQRQNLNVEQCTAKCKFILKKLCEYRSLWPPARVSRNLLEINVNLRVVVSCA